MTRWYPDDTESRPGYFRQGTRAPWSVYRVGWSGLREDDERYCVVFNPNEATLLVRALNAAVERGEMPIPTDDHGV